MAVWPDRAAAEALAALDRPDLPGLRWSRPDQWHVTLLFLGEADPLPASSSLARARFPPGPVIAWAGPALSRLGRTVLQVPVAGLDGLAAAVAGSLTDPAGSGGEAFTGHLTLARARRPGDLGPLVGAPFRVEWPVGEVTLLSSRRGPQGSDYKVVGRWPLEV